MRLLYTFFIRIYYLIVFLVSFFDKKAKQWINGRRNVEYPIIGKQHKLIWFHTASLGEFEQSRPVIEALKKDNPDIKILLTFFSPSGYEVRKNYDKADFVFYLPADTPGAVSKFLNSFNPTAAVFVKYEYWYNFMAGLSRRNIPFYYISAIYRPSQVFFKSYGGWFRRHLKMAEHIFCQDKKSAALLQSAGIGNVSVAGDTRFDRVADVTANPQPVREIEGFAKDARVILGGSTWPPGEDILSEYLKTAPKDVKMIIAPHLVDNEHIDATVRRFEKHGVIRLSEFTADFDGRVLIIDGIGFLMHLYRYCAIAYIGGGFGDGIHNILEAAAFSKPVIFGPRHIKFREAVELISLGGGFAVNNGDEFDRIAGKLLSNDDYLKEVSGIAGNYVAGNTGATELILSELRRDVL